jgi:hypothetical protein
MIDTLLAAAGPIAAMSIGIFVVFGIPIALLRMWLPRGKDTVVYLADPGPPCPNCATPTVSMATFCHRCGTRLPDHRSG